MRGTLRQFFVLCGFIILQYGHNCNRASAMTPLEKLRNDPLEAQKPMTQVTQDILRAREIEVRVAKAIAGEAGGKGKRRGGPREEHHEPLGFEEGFRQLQRVKTQSKRMHMASKTLSLIPSMPQWYLPNPENFLILKNSQVLCNGADLLGVKESLPFGEASTACGRISDCNFFVWKQGSLTQPSAAWFCSGSGWLAPALALNWVTGVRPDELKADNLQVYINAKLPCSQDRLVDTVYGPLSVKAAAARCEKLTGGCVYFTINYGASHSEDFVNARQDFGQKTYFCRGAGKDPSVEPNPSSLDDGWLTGVYRGAIGKTRVVSSEMPVGSETGIAQRALGAKARASGTTRTTPWPQESNGPVLLHRYFYPFQKGEVVTTNNLYRRWRSG